MNNIKTFLANHFTTHRLFYIGIPVLVLALWLASKLIWDATGRAPNSDPGQIMDFLYNVGACLFAIILVVLVKSHETLNKRFTLDPAVWTQEIADAFDVTLPPTVTPAPASGTPAAVATLSPTVAGTPSASTGSTVAIPPGVVTVGTWKDAAISRLSTLLLLALFIWALKH